MARQLERELSNRHIQLIAMVVLLAQDYFRFWTNDFVNRAIPTNHLSNYWYSVICFHESTGELLLSNTRFNSFVDIANEYLGPFGGFVIGWTYWLSWIVSSMSDLTAMGQYFSFGFQTFLTG